MVRGVWVILAALLFVAARGAVADEPVVLSVDTVWSGAVEVSAETVVEAGVTLLILPGSTVRFAARPGGEGVKPPPRLLVRGALVAQGTGEEPIVFTSAAAKPSAGDWGGILFDRSPDVLSRLRHCRVEYATTGVSGGKAAVVIEDCEIARNRTGLSALQKFNGSLFGVTVQENEIGLHFNQNQEFAIGNCVIRGNKKAGIVCVNGSSPRLLDSRIVENGDDGIACLQSSSPWIEGNEVRGHKHGIYLELKSNPTVINNDIVENDTGVWAEKLVSPLIEHNAVKGNRVGIYCNYSAYPDIHDNDLSENRSFALVLGDNQSIQVEKRIPFRDKGQYFDSTPVEPRVLPPQTRKFTPHRRSEEGVVDARGNWWGASSTAQMKESGGKGNVGSIEDGVDKPQTQYEGASFPRDVVLFAPWEDAPPAGAGRQPTRYSGVRGKVLFEGKPVAGVRVFAYEEVAEGFAGEGFALSSPSAGDGAYRLTLKPGRYFLVGKRAEPPFPAKEPGPGELFGYYGGNPVTVSAGAFAEANVQVVRRKPVLADKGEGDTGVLHGVVLGPAGPEEGASVYVYPDAGAGFRGPDLTGPQGSVPGGTGPDGSFAVEVPPGTYHVVAARRRGGAPLGPLKAGDHFGYFDGNPVRVEAGQRIGITVQVQEKLRETASARAGAAVSSAIRGVLRDPSGKPRAGLFAFASTEPNLAGRMPPFRSQPVGPDGAYVIELPKGGTYYVGARSGYGGPPLPGQWQGVYGDAEVRPVVVEEGKVTADVDVTVRVVE